MYHEAYMGFGVLQSGHRIWVNAHGRLRDGTASMARRCAFGLHTGSTVPFGRS
jgi:hypothetical protein